MSQPVVMPVISTDNRMIFLFASWFPPFKIISIVKSIDYYFSVNLMLVKELVAFFLSSPYFRLFLREREKESWTAFPVSLFGFALSLTGSKSSAWSSNFRTSCLTAIPRWNPKTTLKKTSELPGLLCRPTQATGQAASDRTTIRLARTAGSIWAGPRSAAFAHLSSQPKGQSTWCHDMPSLWRASPVSLFQWRQTPKPGSLQGLLRPFTAR